MLSEGILIVSIESKVVTPDYINSVIDEIKKEGVSLTILLLDELEKINHQAFGNYDEDEIPRIVKSRCDEIIANLKNSTFVEVKIINWNDFLLQYSEAQDYISKVSIIYEKNPKFKSHCINQTYKNLQPILVRKGIFKNNLLILGKLVKYLLNEIGIKLFFNNENIFDVEIAPEKEMEVIEAIYEGKYQEFIELARNRAKLRIIKPKIRSNEINLQSIFFSYSDKENDFKIENLNLKIPSGKIFGILGKNGSGKSTILNIIGGHLQPKSGKILLGNHDITKLSPRERPISTVFQENSLFPHLNVLNNLKFGLQAQKKYSKGLINDITRRQLSDFKLEDYENIYPKKLSVGIRQRVSIARALLTNPCVLLLDEPIFSLDYYEQNRFINILRWLSEQFNSTNIIVVSHNKDFIFSVCEYLCIIDEGQIIAEGETKSLYFNPPNTFVAKILESGNLIEGFLDNNLIFKSNNGEIDILFDRKYSYLRNQKCFLLIRLDSFVLEEKKDSSHINLCARVISRHFKPSFNEVTFCTSKGLYFKINVPHSKTEKVNFEINKIYSVNFLKKDTRLLSNNFEN